MSRSFKIVLATIILAAPSLMISANAASTLPGRPAGFISKTAQVGSVQIHYEIGGSGPPILLIHGWPETSYEWRKVMPILAARNTVVAADLRGMGGSSLEPGGYDKKTLAQDMHALMVQLKLNQAVIVGHDWGGPVAYAYAAQFPASVEKLVLIEGPPFGPWTKDTNIYWFFNFIRVPNGYAESLVTGRERQFLRYFYVAADEQPVPVFDEKTINLYSNAYARPGRMRPSFSLYRAIDQDVQDNAEFARTKLTMPVLAIGAEKGAKNVVAQSANEVATHVTPLLFHGTGHFIPEERPQALSKIISDFIDGKEIPTDWEPNE